MAVRGQDDLEDVPEDCKCVYVWWGERSRRRLSLWALGVKGAPGLVSRGRRERALV